MMYAWRRMTETQRDAVLAARRARRYPWHAPPTARIPDRCFHLTAACLEHLPLIGRTPERMTAFEADLLAELDAAGAAVRAWCVLPNHYHVLAHGRDVVALKRALGRVHGRSAHAWNLEDAAAGRHVWFKVADRYVRSEPHFWVTVNYIHNNPIKHRYVERWAEWPWSSASAFVEKVGRPEAERIWREYPVLDYGRGWDDGEDRPPARGRR